MAKSDKDDAPKWPLPGDVSVNSSVRILRRPESPLVRVYGNSCPPGTHVGPGGVVTSDNYVPPSPDSTP